MIIERMHQIGISSDVLQILGFASIFASIATWRAAKGSGDDVAHAERFGIFVGLWAPTFFALASEVAVVENTNKDA